ncbi:S-layer homology domain-containing protein [Cohnella zeiphila]|uniref:S-layer homology domain-containing protein n=1 Tax=Cohnella zeiphila TaxID=2761120 RepID=A0A7X0SHQ3_9BACL|nr:S-layer homology domain-containing protein [Cohnella zeiphila]
MGRFYRRWKIALGALSLLLAVSGWTGAVFAAPAASGSNAAGHWAASTLQKWEDAGLLTGDGSGNLEPDRNVTRAEFLSLANRAFGLTATAAASFKDVPAAAWYAGELGKAVQAGYVSGYTDGTFRPSQAVTRQEAAAMLAGLGKLRDASAAAEADGYKDAASIGGRSRGAVGALKSARVLEGFADGTFRPNAPLTRAEAVVALDRLLRATAAKDAVYDKAGTYGPEIGSEEIAGNAVVKAPGVTLRNLTIKGDLLLDQAIGEGDVTLQNVTVEGKTTVAGGGEHSVHLIDSRFGSLTVNKPDGKIRLVTEGKTIIVQLEVRSESLFEMGSDSSVETLTVYAVIQVTGQGRIAHVTLHVLGSSFERQPGEVEQASDIPPASGNSGGSNAGTGGSSGNGGSNGSGGTSDPAPAIAGVEDGKTYTASAKPASADTDIAGVTLTKNGEPVTGYELGTAISENGDYVLTVTDNGGHATTVHFTVAIPVDLPPAISGVADGETYTAAVTPASEDDDIANATLTKNGEPVAGYELGAAISENGDYTLTVTDNGGHATTVHFTVAVPVDLPPAISGVADGETYTAAVTPASADTDIAGITLTKNGEPVAGYELGAAISENGDYALTVTDNGGHATTVHFTVAIPPVRIVPDLSNLDPQSRNVNLSIRITNTGPDIENALYGVRMTVPGYDMYDKVWVSYDDDGDSFTLDRAEEGSDEFVGYFSPTGEPFTLANGTDQTADFTIDLGYYTEPRTVNLSAWVADADAPDEADALYRMNPIDIPLQPNYIGPIDDLEVAGVAEDTVTLRFPEPAEADSYEVWYKINSDAWSWVTAYPDANEYVVDPVTKTVTVTVHPIYGSDVEYMFKVYVSGGLYDGESNTVTATPSSEG